MGAVYTATHRQNGKRVAIKVMTPTSEANAVKLAARFEREIKLLGKFRHPNIVRFYGASEDQGIRYYAMELVEGQSLDDLLEKEGILSFRKQLATAFKYARRCRNARDRSDSSGLEAWQCPGHFGRESEAY